MWLRLMGFWIGWAVYVYFFHIITVMFCPHAVNRGNVRWNINFQLQFDLKFPFNSEYFTKWMKPSNAGVIEGETNQKDDESKLEVFFSN